MNINRNNYEAYFLDYLEDRLTGEQLERLKLFLSENPDLLQELKDYDPVYLKAEDAVVFDRKNDLKKKVAQSDITINNDNYQEFFIRHHEGDLNKEEKNELEKFIGQDRSLLKEMNAFGNTFLKPELSVAYPDKTNLKKKNFNRRILYPVMAVAAALLIFMGIDIMIPGTNTNRIPSVSRIESLELSSIPADNQLPERVNLLEHGVANIPLDLKLSPTEDRRKKIPSVESIPPLACLAIPATKNELALVLTDHSEASDVAGYFELAMHTDNSEDQNEKAFFGKIVEKVKGIFVPQNSTLTLFKKDKVPFWVTLIEGYDKLTDSNLDVIRSYNKDGEITAFNIRSENLNIYRKVDD